MLISGILRKSAASHQYKEYASISSNFFCLTFFYINPQASAKNVAAERQTKSANKSYQKHSGLVTKIC